MKLGTTAVIAGVLIAAAVFLMADRRTRFGPPPRPAPPVAMAPAAVSAPAAQPLHDDAVETLPPGPGRQETFEACAACHGTMILRQQGMTRAQWDDSIDWMIERHGMARPDDAQRAAIVDYLAAQFPPRARRGRDSPFLKD